MGITRRVFISVPADHVIKNKRQIAFKWGLMELIRNCGYVPEVFFNPKSSAGLAAGTAWTPDAAEDLLKSCVGAVLIGFPRWRFLGKGGPTLMATEYCQYEGALARAFGLPLLVLIQDGVLRRGVFDNSFGAYITAFPKNVDPTWLESDFCRIAIDKWISQMKSKRDIFLGYCSSSTSLAQQIKDFVERETGASILDWQTDFTLGGTILDEITEASNRCNAGIFLFTQDDNVLETRSQTDQKDALNWASPRDNVVFEAGYFISSKGSKRVLIVRQEGTKMPADLGGMIYTSLASRTAIEPIKDQLRKFVDQL